ncbi:class I SAM-dependent methyltransferase [Aromatoleum tolulyticum]|uniref:class I SAM-dependent methyltransferase n=1 Tax=Aromatoleum tolulyticum TaxID=34027 RepID=UPI001BB069A5
MALAAAILNAYGETGIFSDFCSAVRPLRVLEINLAGNLTPFLSSINGHRLVQYPDFDMQDLDLPSDSFDLVVHSDTLEHVQNPTRGLSECYRVLRTGGHCIFTIPIVVDRMSRSREGLRPSYHGRSNVQESDQLVRTEFGADFWKFVILSGFRNCRIFSYEYPAAMAVIARK